MVLAQTVAQLCQQRIVRNQRQICDVNFVGMFLSASGADRNQHGPGITRPRSHGHFRRHLIARINNRLCPRRKKRQPICRVDKVFNALHMAMGVDQRNAFAHGLHFGLSQRVLQSMHLTVDIGLCHMVQINQGEAANTTACQSLCRPRSYAAHPYNDYVRCTNLRCTRQAIQTLESAKTPLLQVCYRAFQ